MIFVVLALLALSGSSLAQRNPNPCLGKPSTPVTFVNDYGNCEWYFWCNGEQAVVSGPCQEGWNFDEDGGTCNSGFVCDNADPPCPEDENGDPIENFAVAMGDLVEDPNCQKYTFCVGGVRIATDPEEYRVCGPGTAFNRIIGACDVATNVVCPGGGSLTSSSCYKDGVPITGDVNSPTSCAAYKFCNQGSLDDEEQFCPGTLHFNPTSGTCDLPENLDPACTDPPALGKAKEHIHVPRAPNAKNISLRERFLSKLHLRH